ncbi:MAG: GDP-mannose 4,6-dehydratase, partial [Planctomycetota bacterium]
EFCEIAFNHIDLPIRWEGCGVDERGVAGDGRTLVQVDPKYFRPTEVDLVVGDASKATELLDWRPRVGFEELVRMMVDADLQGVDED